MRRTKRGSLDRAAGASAVIVWLAGVYALPVLHNLDHRADHTHGPPGHREDHPHPHTGIRSPDHAQPHRHGDAPGDGSAPVPIDSEHGRGSTLHFAAAAVPGELAALDPGVALHALAEPAPPRGAPLTATRPPLARGPPARGH